MDTTEQIRARWAALVAPAVKGKLRVKGIVCVDCGREARATDAPGVRPNYCGTCWLKRRNIRGRH